MVTTFLRPASDFVISFFKRFFILWIRYISFFSRYPANLAFLFFPILFLLILLTPEVYLSWPLWLKRLCGVYFFGVLFYIVGSWTLYSIHSSSYRQPVTDFLGGGKFLFDLLGSPDPQYGNTRDHLFRTYVVPPTTVGLVFLFHISQSFEIFFNTIG